MSKEEQAIISMSRYNQLLQIENDFNSKKYSATIKFIINNQFIPHWSERFYYDNEEIVIPDNIKNLHNLVDDIIKEFKPIIISEKDRESLYTKIIKWFRDE